MTENEFLDHMVDVSRDPLLNEDPGPIEPLPENENAYRKGWVDALKAAREAVAYLQEDTFYILTEDALDVIDALREEEQAAAQVNTRLRHRPLPEEEWRIRGTAHP